MTVLRIAVVGLLLALTVALFAQQAGNDAGEKPKKEPPVPVTLEGTLKDITSPDAKRPMLSVWCNLETADGAVRLELAPPKYLETIGLKLQADQKVQIDGLQRERDGKKDVFVRDLTLDANTYNFRNEKGMNLWGPYCGYPETTREGTVKDLVQPAVQPAGEGGKGEKTKPVKITFNLQIENGTVKVDVGPDKYLAQIGLVLQADQKVSITGWEMKRGKDGLLLTARAITVDGKIYTLRDDEGRPAWEKPKEKPKDAGKWNAEGGAAK